MLRHARPLLPWLLAATALLRPVPGAAQTAPLLLQNGRFEVGVRWSAIGQHDVPAASVALTANAGYFTFFDPGNVELLVKVLDACSSPDPRFWVFAAGLTNVEVTLDVTDRWSGEHETFHTAGGAPFEPLQRTDLFATCDAQRPCGQGNASDLAASPRANSDAEGLAIFLDGAVVARQATYDLVVADLASIALLDPKLGEHWFSPKFDLQSIVVGVGSDTSHDFGSPDWNCLNTWYRVNEIQPVIANYVALSFPPRLDTRKIIADYRARAGIANAEINLYFRVPEFPYQNLCAVRDGADDIVYFFTGVIPHPRQVRTRSGAAPVEEFFDSVRYQPCLAFSM